MSNLQTVYYYVGPGNDHALSGEQRRYEGDIGRVNQECPVARALTEHFISPSLFSLDASCEERAFLLPYKVRQHYPSTERQM